MSDLKNPMRFSMKNRTIDIANWMDHDDEVDYVQRYVTAIEVRPSEGNIYVHWDDEGLSETSREILREADELMEEMEEEE